MLSRVPGLEVCGVRAMKPWPLELELAKVEAELANAVREIERLKVENERLAAACVDASLAAYP